MYPSLFFVISYEKLKKHAIIFLIYQLRECEGMKKIILIDASGLLFRSYFAMLKNPLYTKNGQPTSAVFGFLRMIFHVIKKYPCHGIAAAFDVPRHTLERKKEFDGYKATRRETPPDLIEQISIAKQCLELAGIPAIVKEGYEADDVLASLVHRYSEENEILIFTGDKDLLQLVGNNVLAVLPSKKSGDGILILDKDGVKELKGVYPSEIKDFLAIVGDTSDNIPGVKGIGEKGAVKLIEEYHSLENIYQNLEHIPASLAKKLEEHRDAAFMSLELVKLNHDLDVEIPKIYEGILTLSDVASAPFLDKLQELELHSLIKEIVRRLQEESKESQGSLELFPTSCRQKNIQKFHLTTLDILSSSDIISLQFEDNILEFAGSDEIFHLSVERIPEFKEMLSMFFSALHENKKEILVFDYKKLIHIFGAFDIFLPKCQDLKLMAYLLDPARSVYSIEALSFSYIGQHETTAKIFPQLFQIMENSLSEKNMLAIYEQIELPLRPILAELESIGVKIDIPLLQKISLQLDKQLEVLSQKIYHLAGREFNILSPKQLGQILFEEIGLQPYKKTKTKSYSTDEESLEALSFIHPLPREVLQYRSLSKFKNTYTDSLPKLADEHHRLHTTLHQTVTATGRLSSGDPNLQNIPIKSELGKEIRSAFIPSEGKILISADYSQIELRLFAHLSSDEKMRKFFLEGKDIHRQTASLMFGIQEEDITQDQRRAAKTINYGISYGMSAFRLANELEVDFSKAKDFIDRYFETFPGVSKFMQSTLEFAHDNGFVQTMYGRRRPTPELLRKKIDKLTNLSHPSRFAINAVVQGTAADIIKKSMIQIHHMILESYVNDVQMILQVHDELLFEANPKTSELFVNDLSKVMAEIAMPDLLLEVNVGIGSNWAEAH
ncbi:MAG: DNA polymerase I [Brevinemataceae bacterium]